MEIVEVIRRYFDSQRISQISKLSGIDRKTIRKYIKEVTAFGITRYDKEKLLSILPDIIPKLSGRPNKAQGILQPYREEISKLITGTDNKINPKTAFWESMAMPEVIQEKYVLGGKVSYSSFKRFICENKFVLYNDKTTCRLEYQPGEQVQIDYAEMGMLHDPLSKRNGQSMLS